MIVGLINNIGQPAQLRRLARKQWPWTPKNLIEVWRSKRFLVQIYQESAGIVRMSVNTTEFGGHRRFADGISWDDLQALKTECGRGHLFAVEIYPPEVDVVNVANMRHLWIYPEGTGWSCIMGAKSNIQWCDSTWNPIRGCSRVSAGCMNCYAEKVAARFSYPGRQHHAGGSDMEETPDGPYLGLIHNGKWNGAVRLIEDHLLDPLRWKKPRRIFVNSMSDLFHENVPDEWIDRIFAVMALAPQHTFQVLTKRPERMLQYLTKLSDVGPFTTRAAQLRIDRCAAEMNGGKFSGNGWPLPNVWLGVSVEDQKSAAERIPLLLDTPAAIRFVSYEPALGPVNFWTSYVETGPEGTPREFWQSAGWIEKLDWIIVGGESGPGARRFDPAWARTVVEQCKSAGTACFVKQMGSAHPFIRSGKNLLNRKGDDPEQWPEYLRVREFPV